MATKRSPGEGSIVQRRDGRWQASLMTDGLRKTVYGKTRREAFARLNELQKQAAIAGRLPDPRTRTVGDLLDAWLETLEPNVKASTLDHYRLLADTYVRPVLGTVKLTRLTADRIQRLYSKLQRKGHKRTAQLVHCVVHQACDLAVRWRWLAENPDDRTVHPSYRSKRKEVWTHPELAAFLEGIEGHWLAPLWVMAIASGCRLGELLGLGWRDVSLDEGTMRVTKTLQRVKGSYQLGTPKTVNGERTLTLPQEAVAALREQKRQQVQWWQEAGQEWEIWGLVFTGKTGRPLHRSVIAHALRRECQRLGVSELTPHGLRHLHASLLLQEGLPVPVVAQRLGHANPAITMAVYAHVVQRGDQAAAAAMESVFAQTAGS